MPASAAACSKSTAVQRASARSMAARGVPSPGGQPAGPARRRGGGEVGVDAHPAAIAAAIRARDGVVGIQRDAVDAEVAAAFLRRVQHVDADLLARRRADARSRRRPARRPCWFAPPARRRRTKAGRDRRRSATHAPALHRACRPLAIAPAGHCAMWCRRRSVPSGRTGGGPSDFPWRQSSCGGLRSDYIAQGPVRQYANGASVFHGLTRCRRPRASRPIGWSHLLVVLHRLPGSRAGADRARGIECQPCRKPARSHALRPGPPHARCSGCAPICARTTIPPWPPPRVTARSQRCFAAPGQWKLHGDAPAKVDFWLRNLHALSGDLQALGIP